MYPSVHNPARSLLNLITRQEKGPLAGRCSNNRSTTPHYTGRTSGPITLVWEHQFVSLSTGRAQTCASSDDRSHVLRRGKMHHLNDWWYCPT
ncbi:hypothetical protein BaRGS_00040002 [Batillaria attramentaria]|uniref:Uncharacterized protein n=1 Tax=Batillaria attramentaria TaxID=370345 RepID=A0ABD0J218_9CAEN